MSLICSPRPGSIGLAGHWWRWKRLNYSTSWSRVAARIYLIFNAAACLTPLLGHLSQGCLPADSFRALTFLLIRTYVFFCPQRRLLAAVVTTGVGIGCHRLQWSCM